MSLSEVSQSLSKILGSCLILFVLESFRAFWKLFVLEGISYRQIIADRYEKLSYGWTSE